MPVSRARIPSPARQPSAPQTTKPEPGESRPRPRLVALARPRVGLVIAAGAGRRMRETSADDAIVKPITKVLGVPLIVRTLLTLREEGVERAVVVTGYQAHEVEGLLARESRLADLPLCFVRNPDWTRQNGLSVLAAREAVDGSVFLLSMADHLYSADLVRRLRQTVREPRELLLGVDRRVSAVPDPKDAMWVRLGPAERIVDIGKDLLSYDAVDTGVFVADGALFDALAAEKRERGGDCALADGVRHLARQGQARAVDIGDTWWHDVDTRSDLLRVERRLASPARHVEETRDAPL